MTHSEISYRIPVGLPGVELLSCPHVEMDFPPHVHDTLTVWVNDLGGEYFEFRGSRSVLDLNGFGVVNPGEVHANGCAGGLGRHLRTVYVDMEAVAAFLEKRCLTIADGLYTDPLLHDVLVSMHRRLFVSPCMLESQSAFTECFDTLLLRHGRSIEPGSAVEPMRYRRLLEILHDCMEQSVSLTTLSSAIGCSPQHALRIFRNHAGISPHAYLIRIRIAAVKRLLRSGSSVAEAAAQCGFADQSHCTRWFRMLTGTTPAAYRRAVS